MDPTTDQPRPPVSASPGQNATVITEHMNGLMREIRREAADLIDAGRLDPGLQAFLDDQGLVVRDGGRLYFAGLLRLNGDRSPYSSLTGRESWVSSFHPDQFLGTEQPDWATVNLAHSVLLARQVLTRVAALTPMPVDVLVGIDLGGFGSYPSSTFRFYGRRPDDRWLSDDLDEYRQEAVGIYRLPAAADR